MDTFEQIQLEEETKQLIDRSRREYTQQELKRLDEIENVFGAKHPGEISLWMDVWDYCSRSYDTGIAKAYLADATMTANGLTRSKAKDAVSIAEDFELLIEAKPVDIDDPNVDEDTTILRLAQPEERPDLFVESTADLKAFADRDKWVDIWQVAGDISAEIRRGFLQTIIEKSTGFEGDKETRAAIAVGCLCGAISDDGEMYSLSDERPRDIWLSLWDKAGVDLRTPLSEDELQLALRIELFDTDTSGEDYFESALEHNELYSPEDLADDQYVVNDPASEAGPEIIEREGPDPFDDDDSDSGPDAADSTPSTDSDTETVPVDSEATQGPQDDSQDSEDEQAVTEAEPATAAVEASQETPQEPADATETHDTVEGGQSVAPTPKDKSKPPGSFEEYMWNKHGSSAFLQYEDLETVYGTEEPSKGTETEGASTDEDDTGGDTEADEEDKLVRFLTYKEPRHIDDDFDVGRDAVQQFVDEFAEVGNEGDKHMKTAVSQMMNSFEKWADINQITLNKLSSKTSENMRKKRMNEILDELYSVEKARARIDGHKTPLYRPIVLADSICDL